MKLIYSLMRLSVNIQVLLPAMLKSCLDARDPVLLCFYDYIYLVASYWDAYFLTIDMEAL